MTESNNRNTETPAIDSPARAALRRRVEDGIYAEPPPTSFTALTLPDPGDIATRPSPLLASEKLENLVPTALDVLGDAMSIEPRSFDKESTNEIAAWRVKVSAAEKVLVTQTKVDDTRLRHRTNDTLKDVLDKLKLKERDLPKVKMLDLTAE